MNLLLQDYDYKKAQLDSIMKEIERLCKLIPESEQLLAIQGIGLITVAGFLAEVGDVRRFESPRQIQKLDGLSLRENSSGKHKGQTTISKRSRSKLRAILFNAAIPLIATNPEFRKLHRYYTTRESNPLKKTQSVIVISCKLIRVFYAVLTKGVAYDPQKMMSELLYLCLYYYYRQKFRDLIDNYLRVELVKSSENRGDKQASKKDNI